MSEGGKIEFEAMLARNLSFVFTKRKFKDSTNINLKNSGIQSLIKFTYTSQTQVS